MHQLKMALKPLVPRRAGYETLKRPRLGGALELSAFGPSDGNDRTLVEALLDHLLESIRFD